MQDLILIIFSLEHIYLAIWTIFVIVVLLSKKSPHATMAWLLVITLVPVFGMILYLFLGVNWRLKTVVSKIKNTKNVSTSETLDRNLNEDLADKFFGISWQKEGFLDRILSHVALNDESKEVIKLIYNTEKTLPTLNESYEIYHDGKSAFTALIADLESAKHSIFMEYFIWRSDELGNKVKDVLIQKAKEGLEIKLIFDGLGSFFRIDGKYKKALEDAGVEFLYFLDIKNSFLKLNYRNHRKMTVVDGRILHTGGMNLGIEYITGGKHFDSWRDTNIRIVGDIALYYLSVFATDWENSSGKFDFENFRYFLEKRSVKIDSFLMGLSSSGPNSPWASIKYLYTKFITNAKREILIQTPYFVPDFSLFEQLKIAALSGVKVRLMTAGKPDSKLTYWVARTFYEEMLLAGIEIYQFQSGFLHSKVMICDDEISSLGTCNFDSRSFDINYEINSVFYDKDITKELREQFYKDMNSCTKLGYTYFKKDTLLTRLRDSICRLAAPLL